MLPNTSAPLVFNYVYTNHTFLDGGISINQVSLSSSSFLTDPPTFTLVGETSGGPPTNYTWARDGEVITDDGPYNISLSLNDSNPRRFMDSLYVSTLTVTGRYPGVYGYSVTNRATVTSGTVSPLTNNITIEGTVDLSNTATLGRPASQLGYLASSEFKLKSLGLSYQSYC